MSLTVTVQKGHDFSSGNVTRAALNAGAVPTVAVTGSVGTTEIADGAITNAKLATDAVQSSDIEALAVTTAKLGANAVTLAKIDDEAIVSDNLITKKNSASNTNVIEGLEELTDVAVDDYLMVHDTSVDDAVDGTVQLKRAKVSVVQKVGTTEYVVSAAGATGGPTITSTGTDTATIDIDLDGSPFQTMELDGGVTYTFQPLSNQTSSTVKTVTVRVTVGGSGAVTFTGTALAAWEWPERASNTEPSGIDNGKVGLLSLTSFGTGNGNVIAAFAVTE